MQILLPDPVHPLLKRLWQAACAVALIMAVIVARETIVRNTDGSHQLSLGEDFLPVYAAGRLIREGHASDLYAMEPLARIEQEIVVAADLERLPVYGPFLNPPFFAAAYVPFAAMPYRAALRVWVGINLLLICGSAVLLCRMLPPSCDWRARALVPLLLVLPLPFWEAMCHQQNTFLSLFLLCAIVTLWRSAGSRPATDVLCGFLAGLLFYKPQLALAVAIVLVLTRGWRAALGLAVCGSMLLLITLRVTPGTLGAFVHSLPPTIHWMRTALRYNWARQVTPQSFWRLLIQGHVVGETSTSARVLAITTAAGIGIALACAILRHVREKGRDGTSLDRLIAATLVSMPLIMPYYMDYDVTLLAIPAVLLGTEWIRRPAEVTRLDRRLLVLWIVLFLEFYANPGLGSYTGVNLAVPLLALIAAGSIGRCFASRRVATEPPTRYDGMWPHGREPDSRACRLHEEGTRAPV